MSIINYIKTNFPSIIIVGIILVVLIVVSLSIQSPFSNKNAQCPNAAQLVNIHNKNQADKVRVMGAMKYIAMCYFYDDNNDKMHERFEALINEIETSKHIVFSQQDIDLKLIPSFILLSFYDVDTLSRYAIKHIFNDTIVIDNLKNNTCVDAELYDYIQKTGSFSRDMKLFSLENCKRKDA